MKITYHRLLSLPSDVGYVSPIILHPEIMKFIKENAGFEPDEVWVKGNGYYDFVYFLNKVSKDYPYDMVDID